MKHKIQFARGAICFGMLLGLTKPAQAGVADPIIGFFGMPTAVDPAKLFLFTPGTIYSSTNDPGNPNNGPITGSTLLPVAFSGLGGLEIHGRFTAGESQVPVLELDVSTNYTGILTLTSTSSPNILDPSTSTPFIPWSSVDNGIQNGNHTFSFFPQPGSAPMNLFGYYGVLDVRPAAQQDVSAFARSSFSFAGFTEVQNAPEPGAVAMLAGAAVGLLVTVRRRKLRRKSR